MKELSDEIILKITKNSPNDIKIIILKKIGIGKCGNKIISKVELIDLSNNEIQTISNLFLQFPSSWWINLSNNEVNFIYFLSIFYFL